MSERVDQWPGDKVVSCQILGYYLVVTCESHPEQYDVFKGEKRVGYLRMRHGHFRAHAFEPWGPVVFEANPRGDGCFEDDERNLMLAKAVIAIDDYFTLTNRHINFPVQQLEGEKGRIDGISIAEAKALAASLNAREEELERLRAENAAQASKIEVLENTCCVVANDGELATVEWLREQDIAEGMSYDPGLSFMVLESAIHIKYTDNTGATVTLCWETPTRRKVRQIMEALR